jgi:hypothetical protein
LLISFPSENPTNPLGEGKSWPVLSGFSLRKARIGSKLIERKPLLDVFEMHKSGPVYLFSHVCQAKALNIHFEIIWRSGLSDYRR